MHARARSLTVITSSLVLMAAIWYEGGDTFRHFESSAPSESIGTPAAGSLHHGKRLPAAGANFRAYSRLGVLLGRNSVDDRVRDTVVEAYAAVAQEMPETTYVYGETGWPSGGRFRPHKSHRNGRSVDFILPALNASGRSVPLPCSPLNLFCYGLHFDAEGKCGALRLDLPAMAAHLRALAAAASHHGLRIHVVILDDSLREILLADPSGRGLDGIVAFSTKKPWIKHDQHYHVDFEALSSTTVAVPSLPDEYSPSKAPKR